MMSGRQIAVTIALAAGVLVSSFYLLDLKWAVVSCFLGWAMLAIAVIDADRFIIPDAISLPAIPAGLIAVWLLSDAGEAPANVLANCVAATVGLVALYALREAYFRMRGRHGLGLGDVKLVAAAGAWTGLEGLSQVLLLSCVLAMIYVALLAVRNRSAVGPTTAVPFGVFLAPSIWLVWGANAVLAGQVLN
jgi:leader peptidase (prepilin peptidase) / N-methyltransferase